MPSGYEKSPDYGDPPSPGWRGYAKLIIILGVIAAPSIAYYFLFE